MNALLERVFDAKPEAKDDFEWLLQGDWYDGDPCTSLCVKGETVEFDFENQCSGFTFLDYIKSFRDYLKESLKTKNYDKEDEEYIIKSIKVYNLWILDFSSNVNIDENSRITEGKFINNPSWNDFQISFSNVLEEEKRILKNKDFFIFLLKKEHLFKNLKNYEHMFYNSEDKTVYVQFFDFIVHIEYYISNKYEKYYYKVAKREGFRHKNIEKNLFGIEDIEKAIKDYKQINTIIQKIKNIVENNSYKQYLKKIKK